MGAVHEYPLIAVTEVFDMPSVDNLAWDGSLGPTEEIILNKLADVTGDYSWGKGHGYGWSPDMEFNNPIHIIDFEPGEYAYGHELDDSYVGRKLMGNGHHRLAFQALVQGALFVPYCNDMKGSGWQMAITDYPLIAITEVLDMASTDCQGRAENVMERKLRECLEGYDWTPDTVFLHPVLIYGEDSRKIGNGHHRAAWQIYIQGALFLHYADNWCDSTGDY